MLAAHGWLSHAPDAFRGAVVKGACWEMYEAGETIVCAGDDNSGVFGIASGAVAFTTGWGAGDSRLTAILHAGTWFGLAPLFHGGTYSGNSVARSATLVAHLSRSAIDEIVSHHPGWWRFFGMMALSYGETAAGMVSDLLIPDSDRRCIATLLRLAGCRRNTENPVPAVAICTQDELGALANMSRNVVGRVLHSIEVAGLISLEYRLIHIHKPARLREMVDA